MWSIIVGDTDDNEMVEIMVANTNSGKGVIIAESDPLFAELMAVGDKLWQAGGPY